MQKVKLIFANESHIPAIAEIARLSFPDPWPENVFLQTLHNDDNCIWFAADDKTVCGYLVLSCSGTVRSVDDIAVHPDYRRQGIAAFLLKQAHMQYPSSDFWLEVRESNQAAIALYQSLGYVQVGFRKRYYRNPDEGAVLMTKSAENFIDERL